MACAEKHLEEPVRVVLIDGEEIILEGLRYMLARRREGVELVGDTIADKNALSVATDLQADVVLLDVDIRGTSGLQLVAEMMAEEPPFRVVIFTYDGDERHVFEALRLGASGYLLKSLSAAQLADQLIRICNGEVTLDPGIATRIATRTARLQGARSWPGREAGLSERESEVLGQLVNGLCNREIAARLIVGEETVKTHLRSIYRKLKVTDRAQATAAALRQGIFS